MMEKNNEAYLHLYLNNEVVCNYNNKGFKAPGILAGKTIAGQWEVIHESLTFIYKYNSNNIKLVLRPLSDMTDNERFFMNIGANTKNEEIKDFEGFTPNEFLYLLTRSFDLFDLIESGIAIDKTKL